MSFNKELKIAIVCDWLTNLGGAERVILSLHKLFPEAPIFTSVYNGREMDRYFANAKIFTSFIQKIPFARKNHRFFLKLMPLAFEQFDFSDYNIVISSAHSCAKGIITKPETLHICYCHSPIRYVWDDFHNYLKGYKIPKTFRPLIYAELSKIRIWDRIAADRVDCFIANSNCVKDRIYKYYRKESTVINPPVDLKNFKLSEKKGSYFLAVGRLIPYKRFDLLIEVANKFNIPLKIAGQGFRHADLKNLAGKNVEFLGTVTDRELNQIYSSAKALLFPQFEDFGIVPLEAMACGRPVIAFKKGGALDTVQDGKTGILFEEQTVSCLGEAIEKFEKTHFDPIIIRKRAEEFSEENFHEKMGEIVKRKYGEWNMKDE